MLFRQSYRDRETGKRRQSRFWSYEFRFAGSRIRESTALTSKTAAKEAERERRRQLAEGTAGVRRRRPQLLRQAAEEWLALKRGTLSPSSVRIAEQNIARLLPAFGNVLASDLEAQAIARYQERRSAEGAAAATINLEIGTLRAILHRSGLWERLRPDVRALPKPESIGRALSADEEARLLRSCGESASRALLPAVTLALDSGLRREELTGLRWRQVELEARRLTVGKSKTAAGRGRTVPLGDRALATLSAWRRQFPFSQPSDHVFASERYRQLPGGRGFRAYAFDPKSPLDVTIAWRTAKRRTADPERGLPPVKCRWHDLRHTFVTRLLERGYSLPLVARLVGWSASTTVLMARRYGHFSDEALAAAVASLNARTGRN